MNVIIKKLEVFKNNINNNLCRSDNKNEEIEIEKLTDFDYFINIK
jgi:hypothetical protein